MEEEDLENIIFFRIFARHVTCPKKREKGHPSSPHHHEDEVGGGDFGGGRVRGELAPFFIFILFSPATCLFWVFPTQLPNQGKKIQKVKPNRTAKFSVKNRVYW